MSRSTRNIAYAMTLLAACAFIESSSVSIIKGAEAAGADLKRDLRVMFTSERHGDRPGFVLGTVTNRSSHNYPCVLLEFDLMTRFNKRKPGEASRHLGILPVEVRNMRAQTVSKYRKRLPFPAGFGLNKISECEAGPSAQMPSPKIVSFRVKPNSVKPGEWVQLFWEVENVESVKLYENDHEIRGRVELKNGEFGWPPSNPGAFKTTIKNNTKFQLVAENNEGKITNKILMVQIKDTVANNGNCSIVVKLSGKWRQRIRERPHGPASIWIVHMTVVERASGKLIDSAEAKNGSYRSGRIPAGRKYTVAPTWTSEPRERTVLCKRNSRYHMKFRITGSPLID